MIFDLMPARHFDLSSIGYFSLPKSVPAGSATSSHLDTRSRYIGLSKLEMQDSYRAGQHTLSIQNDQACSPVASR
eukprot:6911582-Pyramimonas_sp.AAC.1